MNVGIVWFRRDLRLADNPAWAAATAMCDRVVAAFVVDPQLWDGCHARRRAMLAGNLRSLDGVLAARGGRLWVGRGEPVGTLTELVRQTGAQAVFANRDVSPYAARRDEAASAQLPVRWTDGCFFHAPGSVRSRTGAGYTVFTPYFRAWSALAPEPWPNSGSTEPAADPGAGVPAADASPLETGEEAAERRLAAFADHVDRYATERDRPDLDITSKLSVDLKWGTISPRRVVEALAGESPGRASFVRQVAWRDFWAQIMAARSETVSEALRPEYRDVQWRHDLDGLEAWKRGRTGYPLVDAGMRQLRAEGWIHNRVRMVVASFLVKDLLVDWRLGERHMRRLLLDGDVAQNVGNWQWTAGTGADAAPYFRIFNPVRQSQRFDPAGDYIRRWVPELVDLSSREIHTPWTLGPLELAARTPGYPMPIVDHAEARNRTLAAFEAARRRWAGE